MKRIGSWAGALGACLSIIACGGAEPAGTTTSTSGAGGSSSSASTSSGTGTSSSTGTSPDGCALTADTTETATVNAAGCHVLDRDAGACEKERKDLGLSGFWLSFSCRVALSVSTSGPKVVKAEADGQPDYESNYFPAGNACHAPFPEGIQNPNEIAVKDYVVGFPLEPDQATHSMKGNAIVGLAVNGVPIYGNFAAPGDDIYFEAKTFDRCGGHPQGMGGYHYHAEPYAISNDDSNFIGVMRDGYPIYGRKDPDGSYPQLDEAGGHEGVTVDSPSAPVYHYHVNQQTSMNPMSQGQKQWFLTTGTFHGTPVPCGGCN